ncbi:hypothetical protein RHGRI_014853 [Rhododendron griersonianum]|uniref:Endonuclease/exonuclease/phosphatase domain-containing protein n=1 Tax=Rhododendron griersonianum TaxID=479676 RepID=A0AAV6KBJ9_9ERIC|nr:hypothetical protein RHGRI_014853 [Rhododendron griersonianum]
MLDEEIGSFSVSCLFKNVEDRLTWAFTGVYEPVINYLREDLWAELSAVAFRWEVPWCVGGDFNVIQSALPRITSDHNPILLSSGGIRSGRTPFRFENMWLLSEGFTDRVGEWWNSYSVMGKPSFVLAKKLKLLKEDLRKWNSEVFGNLKDKKDKVVDEIRRWDLEEQYRPLSEVEKVRRSNAKEEFWKIAKFEEISWRQKSRNLWLREGERNTRFFHRMANCNRRKNFIGKIMIDGRTLCREEEISTGANYQSYSETKYYLWEEFVFYLARLNVSNLEI